MPPLPPCYEPQVFHADILNLLSMSDMWRARTPPTPLDFDAIRAGTFVLPPPPTIASSSSSAPPTQKKNDEEEEDAGAGGVRLTNGAHSAAGEGSGRTKAESVENGGASYARAASGAGLRDQRMLSLGDNVELFVSRYVCLAVSRRGCGCRGANQYGCAWFRSANRLAARVRAGEETIVFDKDDDDTLDFVTAAANLRSAAYGIPGKSRWEVKGASESRTIRPRLTAQTDWTDRAAPHTEMAGNIIPAIATTNAVIAGLIVLQALHLLRRAFHALRNVHAQFKPSMPLSAIFTSGPNPACGVCRDAYVEARCDVRVVTLGQLVEGVLGGEGEGEGEDGGTGRREVSVYEGQRVLSDPDWEDNWERTLESLGVTRGKFLAIMDEEGELATIQVAISPLYVCFAPYI